MSLDRLISSIAQKQNPTVAGLDPKWEYIPSYIRQKAVDAYGETLEAAAAAILEFNRGLIDALCDIVPAVKPQCAYYEMYEMCIRDRPWRYHKRAQEGWNKRRPEESS